MISLESSLQVSLQAVWQRVSVADKFAAETSVKSILRQGVPDSTGGPKVIVHDQLDIRYHDVTRERVEGAIRKIAPDSGADGGGLGAKEEHGAQQRVDGPSLFGLAQR